MAEENISAEHEELTFLRKEVTRLRDENSQLGRELALEKDARHIQVKLEEQFDAVADSPELHGGERSFSCCGDGEIVALRQLFGFILIVVIAIVFFATESATEMSWQEHRTLGVLSVTVILWLTELLPIPITGLLVGPLLFLCEVCTLKQALSAYMGNLTIILFGSHFVALAMERHGLHRRLTIHAMSLPFVKGVASRERLAMMLCGWVLSMWVSNTGATNILVPITLSSMGASRKETLPDKAAQRTLTGSLLSVAYGCNAGGMGTLVGTPPNVVAKKFLEMEGLDVGFLSWMLVGIPASALVCCTSFLILLLVYKPASIIQRPAGGTDFESLLSNPIGPMTWGEKVVLSCFVITFMLWTFPAFYTLADGPDHVKLKKMLPAGVAVILGTLPLHIIPDRDQKTRILPWSETQKADWGIIMLVGGGVLLGKTMLDTGLAKRCAEAFILATGVHDIWMLTFLVVCVTIFATEITSNTATTNLMVPIVIAVSKTINPDPSYAAPPVIGVAFAASCAFMMPIATPPNYIVTDTGHVQMIDMVKPGILINWISVPLLVLVIRVLVPQLWPPNE